MKIISVKDYFKRPEISSSDLSELFYALYAREMSDPTEAYAFGTLFDALVTEPENVDFKLKQVIQDGEILQFKDEDFKIAEEMKRSVLKNDLFRQLFTNAKFQIAMSETIELEYRNIKFKIDARCKYDFWQRIFGGDLKSTTATSQSQFDAACLFFGYDRQRAWYMDISGAKTDVIIGVSKKNFKVFTKIINKGDAFYTEGRRKNTELAQYFYFMFGSDKSKLMAA